MSPAQIDYPKAGACRGLVIAFLVTTVTVLAADLISKVLAFQFVAGTPVAVSVGADGAPVHVPEHAARTVIPSILSLKLTLNRGAAFGIGQGARWIFVLAALIAVAVIGHVFWHSRSRDRVLHIALMLMLAGALGNVYDRVAYGHVRDFMLLFPGVKLPFGWTWPGGNDDLYPWIFNVADAAMCIALGMLVLGALFGKRDNKAESAQAAEA